MIQARKAHSDEGRFVTSKMFDLSTSCPGKLTLDRTGGYIFYAETF